jgi:hypothetical protein
MESGERDRYNFVLEKWLQDERSNGCLTYTKTVTGLRIDLYLSFISKKEKTNQG